METDLDTRSVPLSLFFPQSSSCFLFVRRYRSGLFAHSGSLLSGQLLLLCFQRSGLLFLQILLGRSFRLERLLHRRGHDLGLERLKIRHTFTVMASAQGSIDSAATLCPRRAASLYSRLDPLLQLVSILCLKLASLPLDDLFRVELVLHLPHEVVTCSGGGEQSYARRPSYAF